MRQLTAARKGTDGGWHYVSLSERGGHAVGYCTDHDPHPTEGEARDCYARFLREQTITLDQPCGWTACLFPGGCDQPTRAYAGYGDAGYGFVPLCPEHMTHAAVIAYGGLDGPAGDGWVS